MDTKETTTEAAVVAELATRAAVGNIAIRKIEANGRPFAIVADRYGSITTIDLDEYCAPTKKSKMQFTEVESFLDYVKDFMNAATRVFWRDLTFRAIIDYHQQGTGEAQHCEHWASVALDYSEPLKRWLKFVAQPRNQESFVEFLEEFSKDIVEPDGAEVLMMAKELSLATNVAFKSVQRRNDGGYNLSFEKTTTARAGEINQIEVPPRFVLEIPIFRGKPLSVQLPVRLRYRLQEAAVMFDLKLMGLDAILETEVERERNYIAEQLGRPVHAGG